MYLGVFMSARHLPRNEVAERKDVCVSIGMANWFSEVFAFMCDLTSTCTFMHRHKLVLILVNLGILCPLDCSFSGNLYYIMCFSRISEVTTKAGHLFTCFLVPLETFL